MGNLKIVTKRKKRVGRGYGSGKGGHTTGRGQKGQKSRGKVGVIFEGYKVRKSFIKRLPFRRGKGRFEAKAKPLIINLKHLEVFPENSVVNIESLVKYGIVDAKDAKTYGVKILGDGEVTRKLTVELPTSKSASEKITKKGGKVLSSSSAK
ncbi:MAG: 50S ribosomal protein L15 [Candidatus Woesebacteria bacterium GW2011_GWA1_37_8]|uniref:Large ribosomal subunit protein uL15 n=2 Tax=Candidatus Woeseibacteriota TaxID=1752722 RepID=A0A0G0NP92_9BACT|nr:MAG: 50S ribosomal protein L15 [Microgenomates group bacterium GW2011_GWC1_37_12b]KKQ45867.1 MAG: 50S ribosomal protein L15 [Candidatus Woesebacteria bacterium GW2011_GWA1_37_8]KKQ87699.1 MAG: 50S ribosomal protein L15 [Candidatus Woesebacteria bacterium GW2011_GWB1_38_8b]